MGNIILLPEEIANRIAAGEVIERPASVVKELVENSIDALAKTIEIELKSGGRDFIRVSDDGVGMDREDAVLAFKRHSTSKIRTMEDLYNIRTLGFRGEALPSIASVSHIQLITRKHEANLGTKVVVQNGEIIEISDTGASAGTTVIVSQIFFNLPVRRKFLKSPQTELQHCVKILTRLALSAPGISFRLVNDGHEIFFLPQEQELLERIGLLLSRDLLGMLISCQYTSQEIRVWGYIARADNALRNRDGEFIFVNGRPIESKVVSSAMKKGYGGLIPQGRYPQGVIFLEMPGELVDVNVHPSKLEVRFKREELVFSAVMHAVSRAISQVFPTPKEPEKYRVASPPGFERAVDDELIWSKAKQENLFSVERIIKPGEITQVPQEQNSPRLVQLHNSYIMLEVSDGLLIVDQHAAHERILFEQILNGSASGIGKRLLFPLSVKLSPMEMSTLKVHEMRLRSVGFNFVIGDDRVTIESVPPYVRNLERGKFLPRLLQELATIEGENSEGNREFSAEMACKMAIKAGESLSEEEMSFLLDSLFRSENPNTCPHGRPTFIKITLDELETRFGRK